MNIVLINPNTTKSMTTRMHEVVTPFLGEQVRMTPLTAAFGMASIEGYFDEAFVVPPMVELLKPLAGEIDGVVVGCFDDTGVDALRAMLNVPVIGICQAAMLSASMVATGFSVVTTLPRSVPVIEELALRYGMERRCRRIRAADIPVLALEEEGSEAREKIRAEVERAVA
ncbi:MAG: aspartate/glutamate racemase family protein, partial [Pseudomonadota bacterium]|nr:aspartate/glutamate racemase family protein [Pseudomonadota bacterium]